MKMRIIFKRMIVAVMSSFQERVDELQEEIKVLDGKLKMCDRNTLFLFIGAIFTPFIIALLIYFTGFKWIRTDGEKDRKKVVKWTVALSIVVWVLMYIYFRFFMKVAQ